MLLHHVNPLSTVGTSTLPRQISLVWYRWGLSSHMLPECGIMSYVIIANAPVAGMSHVGSRYRTISTLLWLTYVTLTLVLTLYAESSPPLLFFACLQISHRWTPNAISSFQALHRHTCHCSNLWRTPMCVKLPACRNSTLYYSADYQNLKKLPCISIDDDVWKGHWDVYIAMTKKRCCRPR